MICILHRNNLQVHLVKCNADLLYCQGHKLITRSLKLRNQEQKGNFFYFIKKIHPWCLLLSSKEECTWQFYWNKIYSLLMFVTFKLAVLHDYQYITYRSSEKNGKASAFFPAKIWVFFKFLGRVHQSTWVWCVLRPEVNIGITSDM